MLSQFAAVGIGAALGAWLRWGLGQALNHVVPSLPLGTLVANGVGGGLAGAALAWFAAHPAVDPVVRLACMTGFLGGLTTFSAFTAESFVLLSAGRYGAAAIHAALHTAGALLACAAGYALVRAGL